MKKNSKQILLILIMLLCLAVPILSQFVDFGGGTDDAASEIVQGITGKEQVLQTPAIGFEPSEALEPWMFVLQIAIGVAIFIAAFIALKKVNQRSEIKK